MTIITVTSPLGRFSREQRQALAQSLTDAVLVPEVGRPSTAARVGFQVHFRELDLSAMAIGGRLLDDQPQLDVLTVDIAVMDAAWPPAVRAAVINGVFAALTAACGLAAPPSTWWVTFRVIDEGSWGSRGGVLSVLTLLDSGVFTPDRVDEIRQAIDASAD